MFPQVTLRSLLGVWQRRRIAWPDGQEDRSTDVFWLQAGSHYADVRIPADRPRFDGVSCLGDCTPEQLRWLARQQGFAGTLNETRYGWHWARDIDYQPFTGKRDIGKLRYADANCSRMVEVGVEESYREDWKRIDPGDGPALVVRLESRNPPRGYLVAVGGFFLLALDRRPPLPDGASLQELLEHSSGEAPQAPERFLDMELSLGIRRGSQAEWTITRSTFPWREGGRLFPDDVLHFDPSSGRLTTGTLQWRVIEPAQNMTALPLGLMHWPVK